MIEATTQPDLAALRASLEQQARAIAVAQAEAIRAARREPASWWRRADLLWPLFTKG